MFGREIGFISEQPRSEFSKKINCDIFEKLIGTVLLP